MAVCWLLDSVSFLDFFFLTRLASSTGWLAANTFENVDDLHEECELCMAHVLIEAHVHSTGGAGVPRQPCTQVRLFWGHLGALRQAVGMWQCDQAPAVAPQNT